MNLNNACELAIDAARQAGEILRRGLNEVMEVSIKSTAVDLVTEYDRASQECIIRLIRAQFPDHHIVAEEDDVTPIGFGDPSSMFTWYIDPLDGTNNFAHRYPVFSVSIALYFGSEARVAVVYDPTRDECFTAIRGNGAYLQTSGGDVQIQVSKIDALVRSLLATGFPDNRHHSDADNIAQTRALLKRALGIRRSGSAALDLAYVAAGRLDGYWEYKINSWDIAAGLLLVLEAGGQLSMPDGQDLTLSAKNDLVTSNGLIHLEMVRVLREFALTPGAS